MVIPLGKPLEKEYRPTGSFGGFHVRYVIGSGELAILVRVNFKWESSGPSGQLWDLGKINSFKNSLVQEVKDGWSKKWRFRCSAKGFNETVNPFFSIEENSNNPHFTFICHNQHGMSFLNASKNQVELFENDVKGIDEAGRPKTIGMSAGGVMESERRKVETILETVRNVTVTRATGTWRVDPGSEQTLIAFARELSRVSTNSPKYPLVIEASSGIALKAADMVEAVNKLIRIHGGLNYPIIPSPNKTSRKFKNIFSHTPNPTGTVTIRLDDDDNQVRKDWVYRYKVAVHEFGHCLGLPDEYVEKYPGLDTRAHDAWRTLCATAKINPRPVPKFDASIMSCGWMTFPCHYVTVWDALTALTEPYLPRLSWTIERGTEPDTL